MTDRMTEMLDELEHAREQLEFAKEENRSLARALEQSQARANELDGAVDRCKGYYEDILKEYRKARADAESEAERLKDLVRNLAKML